MADGNRDQSPFDAEREYQDHVAKNRASCDIKNAAQVLHAVQDGFSPAHRNFQQWDGKGESLLALIKHGIADAFPSPSAWEGSVAASATEIQGFIERCPCLCKK